MDGFPEDFPLDVAIQDILLNDWDPLVVRGLPGQRGAYDEFIGTLMGMVLEGAPATEICGYLLAVEQNLTGRPGDRVRTLAVARALEALGRDSEGGDADVCVT